MEIITIAAIAAVVSAITGAAAYYGVRLRSKAIIKEAELIIERVQLFAQRFKDIEGCLTATRDSFDRLKLLMADSGKSIITPARNLIAYGVKESKSTTSKRGKNSKVSLSVIALEGDAEAIAEDQMEAIAE